LRTSWLSREIIAFSLFAGLAGAFAGSFFVPQFPEALIPPLGMAGGAAGILGVFCSVMVYTATRRAHWRGAATGFKFATTTLILGSATVLMISMITSAETATAALPTPPLFVTSGAYRVLTFLLLASAGLKLTAEAVGFLHLRDTHHSVQKRIALLMIGDLKRVTQARFVCGALGGLVLPVAGTLLLRFGPPGGGPYPIAALTLMATLSFACCLAGELAERYLFFAAAPASKMPGGIA
jgi:DMSO reductase anchor subunit